MADNLPDVADLGVGKTEKAVMDLQVEHAIHIEASREDQIGHLGHLSRIPVLNRKRATVALALFDTPVRVLEIRKENILSIRENSFCCNMSKRTLHPGAGDPHAIEDAMLIPLGDIHDTLQKRNIVGEVAGNPRRHVTGRGLPVTVIKKTFQLA